MLVKRRQAADKVAAKLFSAERALDLAMAEIADLAGEIPRSRLDAGLAMAVAHGAVEHVAEAMAGIVRVRTAVLAAHTALDEAKQQVGLGRVQMFGGGDKPPPEEGTKGLRQVA